MIVYIKEVLTMGMQVRIRKGKEIYTENRKLVESKMNNLSTIADNEIDDYDLIKSCKTAVKSKAITPKAAAIIIVGKLRHIYFSTCQKHDDRFDIESFVYMDKILFDILVEIVEGVIVFGERGISRDVVKETIRNSVELVEYETDINSMYDIVDQTYDVFG